MAETRIWLSGSGLRALMSATNFETGVSSPVSFDWQFSSENVGDAIGGRGSHRRIDGRRDPVPARILAQVARVVAAVVRRRSVHRVIRREERASCGHRAVILARDEDDPEGGIGAQKPSVRGQRWRAVRAQRAIERREWLPELATAVAQLGDALKHFPDSGADGVVRGAEVPVAADVGDERRPRGECGVGAHPLRLSAELAAVALPRAARNRGIQRSADTQVGRYDTDVNVPRLGALAALRQLAEERQLRRQLRLPARHRRAVVDHEDQIELPFDRRGEGPLVGDRGGADLRWQR